MTAPAPPPFLTARTAWARRISPSRWVTIGALALILLQLLVRGTWVSQSWFYSDDFLFLGDVGHGDDDLAWYFRFHFSHFMPLSFLLVKVVTLFGAFSWTAAAVQIIVMQLAASLAAWWMLRTLFGSRLGILVPLTFYLFSAITIPSVMWWAVAINQLPHQIAVFGAIAAHTLYLRHHRARYVVLTAAFMLLGYSTYTKTMLLPIVLLTLTLTYFASGRLGERVMTTVRRDWRAWLVHGVMLLAYVVAYVVRQPPGAPVDFKGNPVSLGFDTLSLGLVPTLTGGPLAWVTWTEPVTVALPSELLILGSWLLLVAAVAYLALTRTRVLRALMIPAVYLAISVGLIYVGRFYIINALGTFYVSRHVQYLADTGVLITMTMGLMSMRLVGAVESSEPRTVPLLTLRPHRGLLTALAVIMLAGSFTSSARFADPWRDEFPQRQFFERATVALAEERPHLADTPIPAIGISPFLHPNNLPDVAFSPVADTFTTSSVGTDLQIFRDDATLAYAKIDGPVRTKQDPSEPCAYQVRREPRTIQFVPVVEYPLWMGISYHANRGGTVSMSFGDRTLDVPIAAGSHTLFVSASADYDSVTLRPLPSQRICVSAVRVGGLTPQGQS